MESSRLPGNIACVGKKLDIITEERGIGRERSEDVGVTNNRGAGSSHPPPIHEC